MLGLILSRFMVRLGYMLPLRSMETCDTYVVLTLLTLIKDSIDNL